MAGRNNPLVMLQDTKLPLWVSLLLLILILAVFGWKQLALSQADQKMADQAQQFETDKAVLRAETEKMLAQNSDASHRLLGNSLAWAIRGELIRNNLDQIDQYFNELVKNERIKLAVVSSQDGKVLVASDKKFQDGEFGQIFPAALLEASEIAVQAGDGEEKLLVMPIMGLNNRLGTAVLRYTPEKLVLDGK